MPQRSGRRLDRDYRRLGPIPEEAFAPGALLDGTTVASTAADEPWTGPETFADWYPTPLAAGIASALAGTTLGIPGGFHRPGAA